MAQSTDTTSEKMNMELKGKSKINPLLIGAIVVVLLIGGIGTVIYFNLGNITEAYLRPMIQNVPVVKNILPPVKVTDTNATKTKEELLQEISSLTEQLNTLQSQRQTSQTELDNLKKENTRLQEIEQKYQDFQTEKQTFDQMVANQDQNAFTSFYEKMNPKTAEVIYKQIVQDQQQAKQEKQYADTYQQMDASSGAAILEKMMVTDMDLVVLIISNIDSEQRAKILAAMSPDNAARITKRMSPVGP